MAAATSAPAEMLAQLEQARKLALADPAVYNQVVPGIVPIIGPTAAIEVQRWGAEFIAEAFAAPALPAQQKEQLAGDVMTLLRGMLEAQPEDSTVVRSAVQAAASIYPYVFRRTIYNPDIPSLWQDMSTIKLNILRRMDVSSPSVRICCIKFVQKVVQVQTPSVITDPRRPEQNDISLALLSRNNHILSVGNLEAEASALLDRLLSVIEENSTDSLLVDATMNCLAVLIRTRPAVSNKIISVVLNYNPLKQTNSPMTPKTLVMIKSLERTTRALLLYVVKRLPGHPMDQKIRAYLERLQRSKTMLFSEANSLKRPAEPIDGFDDAKRQRVEQRVTYPPMPPPPNTLAQLFTLTTDKHLQNFDVRSLPEELVGHISYLLMQHIDGKSLDEAVGEINKRYHMLQQAAKPTTQDADDDEDDYDPEALAGTEMSSAPIPKAPLEDIVQPMLELGPFELPKPPPLTDEEIAMLSDETISRVFEMALLSEGSQTANKVKTGINRLAASTNDKESWITMMTRIATRAPAGLEVVAKAQVDGKTEDDIKSEDQSAEQNSLSIVAMRIRELLFNYVLEDWRHRLPIAISWLTEEWYADKIQAKGTINGDEPLIKDGSELPNYKYWSIRLVDNLIPRFDASDRNMLIRFLSEMPAIDEEMLQQVKRLARDPATVRNCVMALQYLYMMRPPIRVPVVDIMQEIWQEGDADVKTSTASLLNKWRPGFVEQAVQKTKEEAEAAFGTEAKTEE